MDSSTQADLAQAIGRLWARHFPEIMARVAILEAAAETFAAGALDLHQREDAASAAHKLAGVLGSFGLARGTSLARELEILYSLENGPAPESASRLAPIAAELRVLVENRE